MYQTAVYFIPKAMKKIIFLLSFYLVSIPITAQAIHLIMVSDYADSIFGKVTVENETNIEQMFQRVSTNLGYLLNKTYLNTGNKLFNRTQIISKLNNLKTSPEDIIVFYYDGFGFYSPTSKSEFPIFTLDKSNDKILSFDDVATILTLKNNRLAIVIADIRNTENQQLSEMPVGTILAAENLGKIITKKIFLAQSGIYKILSAKKGMPSYPHFTESFVDAFFGNLEISESESIKQMSLDNVMGLTQTFINSRISLSVNKAPQEILWSFTKLNKKVKSYQPPELNIPTPQELKVQIELLINTVDKTMRAKIESDTRTFFAPNATIELMIIPKDSLQAVNLPIKLSLDQYIKQSAGYDAKAKRSIENFNVFDFRRTADFKKFKELRITEKIN